MDAWEKNDDRERGCRDLTQVELQVSAKA